ncbi:MAG TPA: YihY/virulence factor BrkB family protein, partial [Acidimicrobiia bacterium]
MTVGRLKWRGHRAALLKKAARAYADDRAIRLGAGLAYYSLFALVPILSLAVSLATIFFGQEALISVTAAVSELLGDDAASALMSAIEGTESATLWLSITSLIVLIFAGGLLFAAWRDIVEIIWGDAAHWSVAATVRNRIFAIAAVLGSSLLLTLTLFAQALLGLFSDRLDNRVVEQLLLITGSIVPILIGTLFIAVLYKYTPTADIRWRDVWFPASVAMVLLSVGAWAYGLYVSLAGLGSAVGVTGTIFLGLAFVYYAAQIILYGIEIV